jgi:hypothetical protein
MMEFDVGNGMFDGSETRPIEGKNQTHQCSGLRKDPENVFPPAVERRPFQLYTSDIGSSPVGTHGGDKLRIRGFRMFYGGLMLSLFPVPGNGGVAFLGHGSLLGGTGEHP